MFPESAIDLEMRIGPTTHPSDRFQRVLTPEKEDNSQNGIPVPC